MSIYKFFLILIGGMLFLLVSLFALAVWTRDELVWAAWGATVAVFLVLVGVTISQLVSKAQSNNQQDMLLVNMKENMAHMNAQMRTINAINQNALMRNFHQNLQLAAGSPNGDMTVPGAQLVIEDDIFDDLGNDFDEASGYIQG